MKNKVIFLAGVLFLFIVSGCGKSETLPVNNDPLQQAQESNKEVRQNDINSQPVDQANSGDDMIAKEIAAESDTGKNVENVEYDVYSAEVMITIVKHSVVSMKPKVVTVPKKGYTHVKIEKRCLVSAPEQCMCIIEDSLIIDCDKNISDIITTNPKYFTWIGEGMNADLSSLNMSTDAFFEQSSGKAADDSMKIKHTQSWYSVSQRTRQFDFNAYYGKNHFDGIVRKYCMANETNSTDICACYFISGKVVPLPYEIVEEKSRKVPGELMEPIIVDEKGFSEYHCKVECDNN